MYNTDNKMGIVEIKLDDNGEYVFVCEKPHNDRPQNDYKNDRSVDWDCNSGWHTR